MVGHFGEGFGRDILLGLGVDEVDGDVPVSEGKARNTAVYIGTEGQVSNCSVLPRAMPVFCDLSSIAIADWALT